MGVVELWFKLLGIVGCTLCWSSCEDVIGFQHCWLQQSNMQPALPTEHDLVVRSTFTPKLCHNRCVGSLPKKHTSLGALEMALDDQNKDSKTKINTKEPVPLRAVLPFNIHSALITMWW